MNTAEALLKKGLWLEYATLSWNVLGFGLLLFAAYTAHSVALAGFGVDSIIEIGASCVVIWQLKSIHTNKEKVALQLIGAAFLLLAVYILVQSYYSFHIKLHADTSALGMIWLFLTLIVMLLLARGKRQVGKALNNLVLITEAKVTVIDALLAAVVLLGLLLNYLFGWWWADSLASIVIVFYALREAVHTFQA